MVKHCQAARLKYLVMIKMSLKVQFTQRPTKTCFIRGKTQGTSSLTLFGGKQYFFVVDLIIDCRIVF